MPGPARVVSGLSAFDQQYQPHPSNLEERHMRVAKVLMFSAAAGIAGLFAATATASPNCPVCQKAYQNCVNKDPGNPANVAACMAQYSVCLSYCGEPPTAAAQRQSLLDTDKFRPDLSATSMARVMPARLAPRAP
jgi:hypothetical protein